MTSSFISIAFLLLVISADVAYFPVAMAQKEPDWPKYVKSASGGGSEPIHKTFEFSAMVVTNFLTGMHMPTCIVAFTITDTNVPATSFRCSFSAFNGKLLDTGGGTFPLLINIKAGETYRLTVDATDIGSMGAQKGELLGVLKDISKLKERK